MSIQQIIIKSNEIIVGANFTKLKTTTSKKPMYLIAALKDGFELWGDYPTFSNKSVKFYVTIDNAKFRLA
jgi:hypothetical protein